jgi:hypothetical protein
LATLPTFIPSLVAATKADFRVTMEVCCLSMSGTSGDSSTHTSYKFCP